jgi:hypothetical protein
MWSLSPELKSPMGLLVIQTHPLISLILLLVYSSSNSSYFKSGAQNVSKNYAVVITKPGETAVEEVSVPKL